MERVSTKLPVVKACLITFKIVSISFFVCFYQPVFGFFSCEYMANDISYILCFIEIIFGD